MVWKRLTALKDLNNRPFIKLGKCLKILIFIDSLSFHKVFALMLYSIHLPSVLTSSANLPSYHLINLGTSLKVKEKVVSFINN